MIGSMTIPREKYLKAPEYAIWNAHFRQCPTCWAFIHESSLKQHSAWHEEMRAALFGSDLCAEPIGQGLPPLPCSECLALIEYSGLIPHASWHREQEAKLRTVVLTAVMADFQHNTVWLDRTSHPWLAQLDPADEDGDVCILVSSLGICSAEDAMKHYGPFTQLGGVLVCD